MAKSKVADLLGKDLSSTESGATTSQQRKKASKNVGTANALINQFDAQTPEQKMLAASLIAQNEGDWGSDAALMNRINELGTQQGLTAAQMAQMRGDNDILAMARGINSGFDSFNNMVGGALDWGVDRFGDLVQGITDSERAGDFIRNATTGEQLAAIPGMAEYFVPVLGEVKGLAESIPDLNEAITGRDSVTGERLENKDRALKGLAGAVNGVMSFIPGLGAVKAGSNGVARGMTRAADDVADATARSLSRASRISSEKGAAYADIASRMQGRTEKEQQDILMDALTRGVGDDVDELGENMIRFNADDFNNMRSRDNVGVEYGWNDANNRTYGMSADDMNARRKALSEERAAEINRDPTLEEVMDEVGFQRERFNPGTQYNREVEIDPNEVRRNMYSTLDQQGRIYSPQQTMYNTFDKRGNPTGERWVTRPQAPNEYLPNDIYTYDPNLNANPELRSLYDAEEQALRNAGRGQVRLDPNNPEDMELIIQQIEEANNATLGRIETAADRMLNGNGAYVTDKTMRGRVNRARSAANAKKETAANNRYLEEFRKLSDEDAAMRTEEANNLRARLFSDAADRERNLVRTEEQIADEAAQAAQPLRDQAAVWNDRSESFSPFSLAEALVDARFGLGSSDAARMFRQGLMNPGGRVSRSIQAAADDSLPLAQRITGLFTGGTPTMRGRAKLERMGENLAENIARGREGVGGSRIPFRRGGGTATDEGVAEVQNMIEEALGRDFVNKGQADAVINRINAAAKRNNVNLKEFKGSAGSKLAQAIAPFLANTTNAMAETGENPYEALRDVYQNATAGEKALLALSMLPGGGRGMRRAMRSRTPFTTAKAMLGANVIGNELEGMGLSPEDMDIMKQIAAGNLDADMSPMSEEVSSGMDKLGTASEDAQSQAVQSLSDRTGRASSKAEAASSAVQRPATYSGPASGKASAAAGQQSAAYSGPASDKASAAAQLLAAYAGPASGKASAAAASLSPAEVATMISIIQSGDEAALMNLIDTYGIDVLSPYISQYGVGRG